MFQSAVGHTENLKNDTCFESVILLLQIFLKEMIPNIVKLYVPGCFLGLFRIVKNGTQPNYAAIKEWLHEL